MMRSRVDATVRETTRVIVLVDAAADRRLVHAAGLFVGAVLVHGADHVRRGVDATGRDVFWLGTTAIALEVAAVVLVCLRHRWAPLLAVVAGASLALGYVLVHFLPARSLFSDALAGGDKVTALSWFAASLEVIAAVALAVAGWLTMRARGGLASAARPYGGQRPARVGLTHPLSVMMIIGNVAIMAVSLPQL